MSNQVSGIFFVVIALTGCSSDPPATGDAGGGSDADGENSDVPFTQGTSTLAGAAHAGYVDGARSVARFANPVNVAYRDGRIYVADFDNNKIRVIDTVSYETTTLIAQPSFQRPFGLAFAADGTLYVSTDNDQNGGHSQMSGSVWRIAPDAHTATLVAAAIGRPRGLAVLSDGRVAVSDYAHQVIELLDPGTGAVTPLAGAWDQPGMVDDTATAARFTTPYGIAVRGDGALVVADFDNHRVRLVTLAGVTSTLAGAGAPGFADGAPGTAMFHRPQAIAAAANGDLFVTDTENFRIRRITADAVQTIAGDGTAGYRDSDDPLTCELFGLEGLAVAPDGSMVYIADGSRGEAMPYNRIRQIAKRW
jgi:DNA-binding beta-propeller fold protein YncE